MNYICKRYYIYYNVTCALTDNDCKTLYHIVSNKKQKQIQLEKKVKFKNGNCINYDNKISIQIQIIIKQKIKLRFTLTKKNIILREDGFH